MIEKVEFGRTGHESTRVLFGGAAFASVTQAEADGTMELLLEYGINHIDAAASYGEAELRIGPWMEKYRDRFFLATKTEERTYSGAMTELENSRRRLKSDVIDLWQMHVLVDEEGWQIAMGGDGALKAFLEARERGWVRYLGVTGHGLQTPDFHSRSLEKHSFDSILLPWNYPMSLNSDYSKKFLALKKICNENRTAVQTIKSLCRRPWPEGVRNRATWYQPLEEQEDIDLAVSYILSHPGLFLNSTGDIHILPKLLKAAESYTKGVIGRPDESEMKALTKRQEMEPLFIPKLKE